MPRKQMSTPQAAYTNNVCNQDELSMQTITHTQFIIYELDLFEHKAYARPTEVNYHTRPRDLTDVTMINAVRTAGALLTHWCIVFLQSSEGLSCPSHLQASRFSFLAC